jgi:hypothetical protein
MVPKLWTYLFQIVSLGISKENEFVMDRVDDILFLLAHKVVVGRAHISMAQQIFDEVRGVLLKKHFVSLFENLQHVEIQALV